MPIQSVSNSFSGVSAYGRESRVRALPLEIEDQSNEREASQSQTDILPTDDTERVSQTQRADAAVLRATPSFDDLPTSQRNALETYLETEQASAAYASNANGSQQIVGVDTFV